MRYLKCFWLVFNFIIKILKPVLICFSKSFFFFFCIKNVSTVNVLIFRWIRAYRCFHTSNNHSLLNCNSRRLNTNSIKPCLRPWATITTRPWTWTTTRPWTRRWWADKTRSCSRPWTQIRGCRLNKREAEPRGVTAPNERRPPPPRMPNLTWTF